MKIEVTLKNYRCFSEAKPARIVFQKGFTALLGVNNAGKSSLLKFFFEFRDLFARFSWGNVQEIVVVLSGSPRAFNFQGSITDNEELFFNANPNDLEVRIRVSPDEGSFPSGLRVPSEVVLTVPRATNTWHASIVIGNSRLVPNSLVIDPKIEAGRLQSARLINNGSHVGELAPYFEAFEKLKSTMYIGAFRNAVNVGSMPTYFDISIGQAFISQWKGLKTGGSRRQNEATYRLTDDIRSVFDFRTLEINSTPDDQTLQLFVDGRSYRLPDLGSGIAQFIIVLANAAVRQPAYILIDEPELNLHPSLQVDFLTTLASYATDGIFFATHSYGLARTTGDAIHCVRREPDGFSEVTPLESTPRLSEFLGELSYSGYAALGFQKILLVEGSTEVKTIQQFLRKLGKDHQIVLLPLGGSQLINGDREAELLEIKRICSCVSALIDSERTAAGATLDPVREAFRELCTKIGIPCCVLERRATDNYLTHAAVTRVKGEKYRSLGPYEKLKELELGWAKAENWRIAREMSFDDIRNTDFGKFLQDL